MAKCLYGSLFDWIVLQLNHALLSKKVPVGNESRGNSIGVLDIFGFEDFQSCNRYAQVPSCLTNGILLRLWPMATYNVNYC